ERLPAARRVLVVVPDDDEVARRAAGQLAAEAEGDPLLRVVEVSVARPLVPDRDAESGALVVLSAGARSAEELAGVAGACADGGHEVVGVVVAGAVLARASGPTDRPVDPPTAVAAVHDHARGGSA
ncbi:polysaccharide biosynthesis protein, partial [Streptomyces sp. SID6013]|nr:polysaccharide biosynthesis protein [Streptomyces sp. SID6013]